MFFRINNLAPIEYSTKIYTQLREFEENIYVMNHNKCMVYPIHNFSDRGYGVHSSIRKQLLSNIDLTQSDSAICESINRINDVTWLLNQNQNKPLLVKDIAIKNLKLIAEESNRQHTEPKELYESSILQKLIDIEEQKSLNELKRISEQKWVEFIQMAKLDLYYKVSQFEHKQIYDGEDRAARDTISEASSSTSYQSTSNYIRPVENTIPLTYISEVHDIRFLYHKWYLHKMLFLNNNARDLFYDNPNETNSEKLRTLHDDGVKLLHEYLDRCLEDKLKELENNGERDCDPTGFWKRKYTKTTMIFHKTSAGDYLMIYGNILGLVSLTTAGLVPTTSLVCATLFDSGLFNNEMVHDLVYKVFVESDPFKSKILSNYYFYDFFPDIFHILSKNLESVKNALPWHTEQPPCYYQDVAHPVMDAIEKQPFDPNNMNSHIPDDMNAHHPNFNDGIQWGKVVLGLGMIAGGITCIASGNIPDLSTIYRILRGGDGI